MPKVWQPEVNLKELRVTVPNLAEPASDVFLKSLLQRQYEKLPDNFKLKAEVHGIYSLPDQWRAKIVIAVTNILG